MTLTWMPVAASKSGARRMSGSATCGPLNVNRLTVVPGGIGAGDCATAGAMLAATSRPRLATTVVARMEWTLAM